MRDYLDSVAVFCFLYVQGFTLEFVFEPNEYFTNETLTKQYLMKFGIDSEAPLEYDGPEIVKCKGSVTRTQAVTLSAHRNNIK